MLGVVALVWLVVSSVIWVFTYDGSRARLEQAEVTSPQQPGGFGNTTTPQQPGGFGNTTTPQQQGVVSNAPSPQPQGLTTVVGQTYTIPAQK